MTPAEERYVRTMISDGREEISRADAKCSILLAALGVVGGALLSAILAHSWSPYGLDGRIAWLWWVGAALAVVSIYSLGYAIYPRLRREGSTPETITFFGDVVATPVAHLRKAIEDAVANAEDGPLGQLRHLAEIAYRKYRALQVALWLIAISSALMVVAVLVNSVIN